MIPYAKYSGRIFLVGNGPSLLSLTEAQIGALNREYLFMGSRYFEWKGATLTPSFYIVSERRQTVDFLDGRHAAIRAAEARFWVDWQPPPDGWVRIPHPPSEAHNVTNFGLFGGLEGQCQDGVDPGHPHLHHGKCTPLAALQVAKVMGFTTFYALGCESTPAGEVYDLNRHRSMHANGIERGVFATAKDVLVDCTPGGMLALERGGPLRYAPLDDVLGLAA